MFNASDSPQIVLKIVAPPGSGKSSLKSLLTTRGYSVWDPDDHLSDSFLATLTSLSAAGDAAAYNHALWDELNIQWNEAGPWDIAFFHSRAAIDAYGGGPPYSVLLPPSVEFAQARITEQARRGQNVPELIAQAAEDYEDAVTNAVPDADIIFDASRGIAELSAMVTEHLKDLRARPSKDKDPDPVEDPLKGDPSHEDLPEKEIEAADFSPSAEDASG
jgi:hypothetical protein